MTDSIKSEYLFTFIVGNHGTARTIEVTCISTDQVVARFDFEEDEATARLYATRFADGLASVYDFGACLDLHGLSKSDDFLTRKYCWPI